MSIRSLFATAWNLCCVISAAVFQRGRRRRIARIVIAMNLIIWPSPRFAAQGIGVFLSQVSQASAQLAVSAREVPVWIRSVFRKKRHQDTPSDRLSSVRGLDVSPAKLVAHVGQTMSFAGRPSDFAGRAVQGLRLSWTSSDPNKAAVSDLGLATFLGPGLAWITASAGAISARAPVLVLAEARQPQTDAEWDAERGRLSIDGSLSPSGGGFKKKLSSILDNLLPAAYAQSGGDDSGDLGFDGLWNNPANLIGNPVNRLTERTHIGNVLPESSNFNLSIPLWSLPGRGVPLNLSLAYNSQLWSLNGSSIVFNAVNTWPYVGFTLGFGRIITYASGSNTSFLLVDGDGTRHFLGTGPASQMATYTTNDGTHITYVGNAINGGTIYYTNGASKTVQMINNRLLVAGMSDTNGNQVGLSYLSSSTTGSCNTGGAAQWHIAISSITDTLGRIITFNYDSCNNLVSITAPGIGGTAQEPVTVTLAQFDYQAVPFSPTFSGSLTVQNAPATVLELQHIYFPASSTGYLLSYSSYGMIYNVSKRVSMSVNSNGTINSGTEAAHAQFNYPTANSSLSGPPAFTARTESPGSTGSWTYQTFTNLKGPNTLTFRVLAPNYATAGYPTYFYTRSTDSTSLANGLSIETDTVSEYNGLTYQSVDYAYANDPGGEPQVQSITTYNDANAPAMTALTYDAYGNVTQQQDYGFQANGAWQVQRQTVNTYVTTSGYVSAYLRSLLSEKQIYDMTQGATGTVVAQTNYAYDNYAAMGNMQNYGGNYSGGSAPPGYNTSYNNQSLTVRGNLTGTTYYSNIAGNVSESFDSKIDIFGNVVQAQVSCCNLNTYTFAADTYWSSADSITQGGSVELTKLIAHDFNTSLTTQTTDPNSLQTNYSYDNSNRPTQTAFPTGATKITTYTDSMMMIAKATNFTSGGAKGSVTTSTVSDGWGRTVQSVNSSGGQVNTTYDPFDRAITVTNPFAVGGSPNATTATAYDPLGRTTLVTLPDGNATQTAYSGATTTFTDQVGRQTQTQKDGLGRLISVTQQGLSGSLNLTTTYGYDMLNNLTQVNQGGQIRAFKFDALSRKIFELLPEQSATINDGTGTMWSRSYTYTSFNKVQARTDARGVVTTYAYDSLNRLYSVSYNTSSAAGVAPTNSITYAFDTSTTSSTKGLLLSISMTGSLLTYQETFGYDGLERLSSRSWTRDGQSYTIAYQFNTGNELTQTTYPDARVVGVTYSGNGMISSVQEPSSGAAYLTSMGYSVAGLKTGISLGNGITETYGYDPNRLQLTSQTANTSGGTSLVNLNYYYKATAGQMGTGTTTGNAGQLMAINNSSTIDGLTESAAYTYDLERRLATATQTSNGQTATRKFDYDQWGNRLDEYDALSGGNELEAMTMAQTNAVTNNQIQSVTTAGGTVSFTYDADGNLTNDGNHTYQYDAENRIVSVDGGGTASYAYDYRNRRVKKTVGATSTHYVWDQRRVLAEHNALNGAGIADYVYAANLMLGTGPGNALGGNGGSFTYYVSDRLNARVLVDKYGNFQGQQNHLPFGEDFAESGAQDKHHLTTYERDAEAGTDYGFNREYEFGLGRFMAADPISDGAFGGGKRGGCSASRGRINPNNPQSLNLYTYALNDPIDSSDQTGLETDSPCDKELEASPDNIGSFIGATGPNPYPDILGDLYGLGLSPCSSGSTGGTGNSPSPSGNNPNCLVLCIRVAGTLIPSYACDGGFWHDCSCEAGAGIFFIPPSPQCPFLSIHCTLPCSDFYGPEA
jgi:RHS repeat-associated protein